MDKLIAQGTASRQKFSADPRPVDKNVPSSFCRTSCSATPIDSLAAAGAVLADVWLEGEHTAMPVVDSLGEEFLNHVRDGMTINVLPDGRVRVI